MKTENNWINKVSNPQNDNLGVIFVERTEEGYLFDVALEEIKSGGALQVDEDLNSLAILGMQQDIKIQKEKKHSNDLLHQEYNNGCIVIKDRKGRLFVVPNDTCSYAFVNRIDPLGEAHLEGCYDLLEFEKGELIGVVAGAMGRSAVKEYVRQELGQEMADKLGAGWAEKTTPTFVQQVAATSRPEDKRKVFFIDSELHPQYKPLDLSESSKFVRTLNAIENNSNARRINDQLLVLASLAETQAIQVMGEKNGITGLQQTYNNGCKIVEDSLGRISISPNATCAYAIVGRVDSNDRSEILSYDLLVYSKGALTDVYAGTAGLSVVKGYVRGELGDVADKLGAATVDMIHRSRSKSSPSRF